MAFILARDAAVVGSGEALVRGIYVMNIDGSGLQLVVGPDELAALRPHPPVRSHARLHPCARSLTPGLNRSCAYSAGTIRRLGQQRWSQ